MKPPTIKLIVAIKEENCKLLKPIIECPLVQPPAYLDPKPTKKPPPTNMIKPRSVNNDEKENSCPGTMLL